ncbi:MAG: T9SS type A sorting domain-containing protein [Chitinophagales bacterium]|nr:T9SS type A sorting domain-containing protein [Chitinophagales bacterium]
MRKVYLLAFIAICMLGNFSYGQLSITSTGVAFTEDFSSLGTSASATLPTGFKIGTDWASGTTTTTVAYGTTGTGVVTSTSPGGAINWANGITGTSTERGLGFLSTGSYSSPRSIILAFTNNTGQTITSLDISFDYEKYRSGSRAFNWTFFHGYSSAPSISETNGDQAYTADANNTVVSNPPTTINKSFTISSLSISSGASYYLRWTYTGVGGSSNAQGLAIDNFSIKAIGSGGGGDPATQLIIFNAPTTGIPNVSLSTFSVKAIAADGISVDPAYSTDITISKASGPGNLTGTLIKTPSGGVVSFNDLKFDAAGTYTLTASSGSLTQATTASITVADATVNTDHFRSNVLSGNWSNAASWQSSHDSTAWITATLAPDNNAASIVVQDTHEINVDASVSAGNLIVEGIVNILATKTFTIVNDGDAASKDLIIANGGTVLNQGTLTIGSGATWQVNDNGSFIQNTTSGISTPLNSATLTDGSNFIYRGSSTLAITPSISGKTYGNLSLISESGIWRTSGSGAGVFTIKGNLSIGTDVRWNLNGYTGTLTFNGSAAQDFNAGDSAITLNNITLNNALGLNVHGSGAKLNIANTLNVQDGTLTTGGIVVLKSDATRTARLAPITTGVISGNVTVERFIPAKASRAWSLLSSPVTQSLQNSWQQQIHFTGAGTGGTVCPTLTAHTNGFDATATNAPSAYTYDASQAQGSRWQVVTNTNATNVGQGTGFRVNVRGPRSLGCDLLNGVNNAPSAATLSATGTLSNSDKNLGTFSITYPNVGINNWVMIGNPYPSAISFSAFQTLNNTIINNSYSIYIPTNPSGIYSYWDGVSFTGGTGYDDFKGNILASGQAFFVQSSIINDLNLSFDETQKLTETNVGYFRTNTINEKVKVSYGTMDNKIDEIVVRYANDATVSNTAISKMDIPSMNSGTYITSLKGNKPMVVQTRALNTLSTDEVWLNIGATQSGNYTFNFSDYENFAGTEIYLVDHLAKTTQNIKENPTYVFSVDVNNAATKGSERFSLVFNRNAQPSVVYNTIKMYPNPANKQVTFLLPQSADISYNIKVTDMAGKIVLQHKAAGGTEQMSIDKLTTGTYIVEIIDSKGNRTTEKLIKN